VLKKLTSFINGEAKHPGSNMSALTTSLIAFVIILVGASAGVFLRTRLPQDHLSEHTRDVIKLGAGLVGTIGALVLSLLIATANSSYDSQKGSIQHLASDFILLDQALGQFGPEARLIRTELRQITGTLADRIWRDSRSNAADRESFAPLAVGEDFAARLLELTPQNDAQRLLKDRAIQVTADIAQTRFQLFEQSGRSLPLPFLVILIFWQAIIFASFGLISPFNSTLAVALTVFAASASGALFLVLELGQPFSGLLRLSSAPLRNALGPL
jgi:hypothetical protein